MLKLKNLLTGITLSFVGATIGVAQDVSLTSADGTLTVEGALLGFDGEYYQIRSAYGDLTLDGSGVSCSGPGCPGLEAFVAQARFAGASSIGEKLLPHLLEGFAHQEDLNLRRVSRSDQAFSYLLVDKVDDTTVAEFAFDLNNSREGIAALQANEADFALTRFGFELTGFPAPRILGLDALTFSVAGENPIREIPFDAIPAVMGGEIDNWQDLGGPDLPLIMADDSLSAPDVQLSDLPELQEKQIAFPAMSDLVSQDSLVIGMTRLSDQGGAVPLRLSGSCGAAFIPDVLSLKTRDYPLPAPQFLYQSPHRKPRLVRQFLRYLGSEAAERDVERAGFVSRRLVEVPLQAQGERLANAVLQAGEDTSLTDLQTMLESLSDARRLTMTFRFQAGSARPDIQSVSDQDALAGLIDQGRFDGKELIFAGFSDGDGGSDANRRIALRRAVAMLQALQGQADVEAAGITLTAYGFGEALPLACDDSDIGREINRRVELWVRDTPKEDDQR